MLVHILHIQHKYIIYNISTYLKQNNIIYGDTLSSVSTYKSLINYKQQSKFKSGDSSSILTKSTESDGFLNTQKKRNLNKYSNTSFDGTVPIICFNDNSITYGTNISFPTERITTTILYHTQYDTTSASSKSDFFLVR